MDDIQRIRTRGNRHVEVVVFRWKGTGVKEQVDKHGGLATINLPGPVYKDANQKDVSWLSYVLSPHDDPSDRDNEWKKESANCFLKWLKKTIELVDRKGRSVWFMSRPVERGRAMIPIGSEGLAPFSHWGILISEIPKGQLLEKMKDRSNSEIVWGDLHELRAHGGYSHYECKDFKAEDYQKGMKFSYLGETEATLEELDLYGI